MSARTEPLTVLDWLGMTAFTPYVTATTCALPAGYEMAQAVYPPSYYAGMANMQPYYSLVSGGRSSESQDSWGYLAWATHDRWRPKPLPKVRWWAVWTREFWFSKPFDLYEVAEWTP